MQNADAGEFIKWGANNIVTGGDLAFFIHGLTNAVKQIKGHAGMETADLSSADLNVA